MRLPADFAAVAASVARYGALTVLALVALGMLRGAVGIERAAPGEAATAEGAALARTTETAEAPSAPLVEVAPPSVLARLRMPVEGVAPEALTDSFADPRPGGRAHHALDIMAPRGTPVRAAAAGTLARIHTSARGGRSLYQIGPDSAYVFYYAHLDAIVDGLEEGQVIHAGDVLGTVGSTGNARTPHLHFGIWTFEDGAVWGGTPVNPYRWLAE